MTNSDEADDPSREIMEATYRALCEHGYAATSISKIADEFAKSKSLLYYHYEDKEDLLEDFLRFLLDEFETEVGSIDKKEPTERLAAILDMLVPRNIDEEEMYFRRAVLEIRSQAPYHEVYQEQIERSDELILGEIIETIERGIDDGTFRPVNARQVAEFIYSTAYGAIERGVTLDDKSVLEEGRRAIDDYVDSQVRSYA
jgi:AcrR family transcriptional regulator